MYEIKYIYEEGKSIHELDAQEKLQLLVGVILPEVRKAIDLGMPKITGTKTFRPATVTHFTKLRDTRMEYLELMAEYGMKESHRIEFMRVLPKLRKIRGFEIDDNSGRQNLC